MANVNVPTNTSIKEKDINNKLQLYGIFQAFSNGKVPSNKQIDVALNSALQSSPMTKPSSKLSQEGRELVVDLKDVIEKAKQLLLSKNEGNLLQDFIWQTQNLDGGNAKLPGAPTDKATAKQHGNEALDGLRTLGTLIISNGQFRKLLSDATVLLRDMAGDAAQKAANRVNPDEERLNQIDAPAEDNTWHDVPDLSAGNLKSQAKGTMAKNKPFSRSDVKEAGQKAMDTADNHPSDDPNQAGRAGLSEAADHLKNTAQSNVPDENQDKARDAKEQAQMKKAELKQNTKDYMGKKMPKERREQTIWRLKKMVVEIQGHSDYQQAIETLLTLAETYGGHAKSTTAAGAGTVKGAHDDDSLQRAEADLKTLLERFANSTSSDDLFDAINNIYRDADQDPELKNWFKSLDRYVRRCLQEQGYILQDASTDEWNALYDKGHFLLRERYRDHTNRIVDELKFLGDQFDADPQNKAFSNSLQKLFQDLGTGEDGKATFKPHLVKDLVNVIIPGIFEHTRYVPIPRIEISDPMIDAVVENLVVESDNLFPNVLEFGNDNYFRLGRRQASSTNEHKVMVAGSGIQCDLKDVAYYVKKKTGFPSITDKGVMDVMLHGQGFSFKLNARTATKSDRAHFVTVDNVNVQVKDLAIKIKQSNHKLLFGIAKPILLKVMRPVIQKAIALQIKSQFERLDNFAYGIHQDAVKAAKAARDDPENAQSIYQNYVNAFQKKMAAKKEKAKEKVSDTSVNMAITKDDSMFKHISLPGGISTKATEFKELASKGDKWESPVFGIGSAKESTNIPRLAQVTRKPHNAASGGVRGGNHPNANTNAFSSNTGTSGATSGFSGNTGTSGATSGFSGNTGTSGATSGFSGNTGTSGATSGFSGNTGTSGATSGFSNQVDNAFDNKTGVSGLTNGAAANTNGGTNATTYYEGVTAH